MKLVLILLTITGIYLTFCWMKKCFNITENMSNGKLTDDEKKQITNIVQEALANQPIIPGVQGKQGPAGKQGNPGPAGGTFVQQGALINRMDTDRIMDRLASIGENAKVFLGENGLDSNKRWTLTSDGQLRNSYGDCITHNDTNVYMNSCNNATKWTYSNKDQTLKPQNDQHMCLSLNGSKTSLKNGGRVIEKDGKTSALDRNLQFAKLEKCENPTPNKQMWVFQ